MLRLKDVFYISIPPEERRRNLKMGHASLVGRQKFCARSCKNRGVDLRTKSFSHLHRLAVLSSAPFTGLTRNWPLYRRESSSCRSAEVVLPKSGAGNTGLTVFQLGS